MDAKRSALAISALLILTNCSQDKGKGKVLDSKLNGQSCAAQAMDDSFLVKWKSEVPAEFTDFRLGSSNVTRFRGVTKEFVETEILAKNIGEVDFAEHNFKVDGFGQEVSPMGSGDTWGLADGQVPDAWNYLGSKGDDVIVAVIDSGVDVNHTLLKNRIYVNTGEVPGNGIDDDHNGFVDDYKGWDFIASSPSFTDYLTHGTHVSGTIAAEEDVGTGIVGVAPKSKIMPLKFIGSAPNDWAGEIGDALAAMDYAVKMGARVINASWGGSQCSESLKSSIAAATSHGTVFVAAAGNESTDVNQIPSWPAAFIVPGKITVAAHNKFQFLASFSNFGVLVDITAPGENILSTVPGNAAAYKSGTSMATPYVSGVAALMIGAKPSLSSVETVQILNDTVSAGNFNIRTKGKVNALKAAQRVK